MCFGVGGGWLEQEKGITPPVFVSSLFSSSLGCSQRFKLRLGCLSYGSLYQLRNNDIFVILSLLFTKNLPFLSLISARSYSITHSQCSFSFHFAA